MIDSIAILFLQDYQPSQFERYLDRYGWPTLIVLLILLVIYKAIWPLGKSYIESLQASAAEAYNMLRERADVAEERAISTHKEFLAALEMQRRSHEDAMKLQAELHGRAAEIQARTHAEAIQSQTSAITAQTAVIKEVRDQMQALTKGVKKGNPE